MKLTGAFDISASALTAQRLRMDVIAGNIANAETTRGELVDGQWVPYRRKTVTFEPRTIQSFEQSLQSAEAAISEGVKVTKIAEDQTPFKRVYDPGHPDANAEGYVLMPNVNVLKEMVDMLSATRSYEANVTALNATKAMITKALEIGRA